MNHHENVKVVAPDNGEAKPKIEKMKQDKFESVSKMEMSLANDSVLHGAIDSKNEEIDENENKHHIWLGYYRKYLKCGFITIGVIVVVVFITLLSVLLKSGSSTKPSDTLIAFQGKLVMLIHEGGGSLLMFDPKTSNSTIIFDTIIPTSRGFDIHANQEIYWTEWVDDPSKTQLKALVNGNTSVVIDDNRFQPQVMALDQVSENLYIADGSTGNIAVVGIRNGECVLLTFDLFEPRDIVLDPEEGLMFILDRYSIVRARMDGTEKITVVNTDVSSMGLDPRRKRLYWVKNFKEIESSDYDGHDRRVRMIFEGAVLTTNLAIIDDKLYGFRLSTLFSCEIGTNRTCDTYTNNYTTSFYLPEYVRGYSSTRDRSVKNPCGLDNGGCQQLCLPAGNNTRSCACRMGWQINNDGRSCHQVRDFLIYMQGGFVRVNSIDGAPKDLVWPTPYNAEANKGIILKDIDFDYDSKNDDFYWTDNIHIYRMKLKKFDGKSTTILGVDKPNATLQDITYDWYTGNMYFVQRHSDRHTLMMFNVNLGEKHRKTLMSIDDKDTYPIHMCPSTLSLHSARNSRFFACKRIIQRASMNNTSLVTIYKNNLEFEHSNGLIAVDYAKDRIYWISDSGLVTTVKHSNFDGSDVRDIRVKVVTNGRAIDVHDRWLFIGDSRSIWRVDKERGEGAVEIASNSGGKTSAIDGFKVISEKVQMSGDGNCCAEGNGGCEQFCLRDEGAPNCMCEDNMIAEGFTCLQEL